MDVDPEDDNGVDAGAIDDDDRIFSIHELSDPEESDGETNKHQMRRKCCQRQDDVVDDEAQDAALPSRLHPNDPGNFPKLCTALKLLVSCPITAAQIEEADGLIHSYCLELIQSATKPLQCFVPLERHVHCS